MTNKILNKIRATIYNFNEGKLNKDEAFDKINNIMDIHNKLRRENKNE